MSMTLVESRYGNSRKKDVMTGANVEAAQRYLTRAWCVLPLRARDKRPLMVWEPLQSARPSAEQVTDWFSR